MKLTELKQKIESSTAYRFERTTDIVDREVLRLQGLPKKREITIRFGNYGTFDDRNGKEVISFNGTDNRDGYSGMGSHCDSVDEVITRRNYEKRECN